jgi:drug/metabolite transporter (DMT)-like permease
LHLKTSGARKNLETAVVVTLWFVFNISLANFTKWLYLFGEICLEGPGHGCVLYKFPLAITVVHMLFSWAVCYIQIYYVRKPVKGALGLSFEQQVRKVAPLAACFALSVAMGNLSLKYIFPSFNQMLGAMSPLITVLLAVVLPPRKSYNRWTWFSMPVICGGLVLCVTKEVNFHAVGAFYAVGATVLRSLKSIMQGRLLDPAETKLDSVTLLYYMSPIAALLLFVVSICTEGSEPYTLLMPRLRWNSFEAPPVTGVGHVLGLLILSGFNACALNIMNFLVTTYTGPVTLQVLGNVKSCASIAVSVAVFGNAINFSQVAGVSTCLIGVWIYTNRGGTVKSTVLEVPKEEHREQELPRKQKDNPDSIIDDDDV